MDYRFQGAGTPRKRVARLSRVCMTHSEEPRVVLPYPSPTMLVPRVTSVDPSGGSLWLDVRSAHKDDPSSSSVLQEALEFGQNEPSRLARRSICITPIPCIPWPWMHANRDEAWCADITRSVVYGHKNILLFTSIFSSACVYTAELLSWRRRPSSINSDFSETAAWIQTKFYMKLPIHHISRPFFFFKILNF